jgi:hypothetical protein
MAAKTKVGKTKDYCLFYGIVPPAGVPENMKEQSVSDAGSVSVIICGVERYLLCWALRQA